MNKKIIFQTGSALISILLTALITFGFLFILGRDPVVIFGRIFSEVFGTGYGFAQTLFKTTPLIISGCAIAICFHAKLFNIGGEGQINAGAFVMALTATSFPGLPFLIILPLSILTGFIVSAVFGLIPAVIKVKKGVSEVITTIMLNFISLAMVNYFLISHFAVESTIRTTKIPENFFFTKLSDFIPSFHGSPLNITLFIALLLALIIYFTIYKTSIGYKLRAIGFNPVASVYMSVNVNKYTIVAFVLAAGMMSFVGLNYIFGYKGFYEYGFSANIGFTAIAVSLLARNNPIGIIFSAFLFGFLDYGGLAVNELVPKEIMLIFQGLVVLSILGVNKLTDNYLKINLERN
ncbi:MAG: ABC transporter permease [Ignavibacteria bacterium]|nr:MAG: ABC transporter permease [Chlorobiota bacterium]MBV6399476.1 hypothetical protein [Ignavibacteria bacterium]MCC6886680.1 ABC transporter permease [Ignavibacteriales bacterium]MCE7953181.1 ABC transporter permease [Chlorobi bacterium CHB7]RIK50052.1 MAG: ABC transporter permease [Ignavibacteriota bacterium]